MPVKSLSETGGFCFRTWWPKVIYWIILMKLLQTRPEVKDKPTSGGVSNACRWMMPGLSPA
jgi:hypothetical protein